MRSLRLLSRYCEERSCRGRPPCLHCDLALGHSRTNSIDSLFLCEQSPETLKKKKLSARNVRNTFVINVLFFYMERDYHCRCFRYELLTESAESILKCKSRQFPSLSFGSTVIVRATPAPLALRRPLLQRSRAGWPTLETKSTAMTSQLLTPEYLINLIPNLYFRSTR